MKKQKLLLITICLFLMNCKTVEQDKIVLPETPETPEIVVVEDLNTASQQINIFIIQEFKWRLYSLDVKWVLGYISDEERETEKGLILQKIDKLTKKD